MITARTEVYALHWMAKLARDAGIQDAELLRISPDASIDVAWRTTQEVCGLSGEGLGLLMAEWFNLLCANLDDGEVTATKLLPYAIASKFNAFPLQYGDRHLVVAVADPTSADLVREVGFAAGRSVYLQIAAPDEIRKAVDGHYRPDRVASLLASSSIEIQDTLELDVPTEIEAVTEEEVDAEPIVRLTKTVFQLAIEQRASDIHIQPMRNTGVVRFRVDGILRTGMHMPLSSMARVISRIKVLSRLDITDRRRPQDGRSSIRVDGRRFELRINTVPTLRAEKAVIRILDDGELSLPSIGIADHEESRIRAVLRRKDGLLILTGPTGSGKTTTLHGLLGELATEDVNIVTVEDPVERELAGLTQVQVEEAHGVTFPSALRAVLRQDPDVLVIGEIRDPETAAIAARASLTGHMVLTTLHTNDALGALSRLYDMEVEPHLVAEILRGIIAQRLLRLVCVDCCEPVGSELTEVEVQLSAELKTRPVVRAIGCEECDLQGYLGRVPVIEFITGSAKLAELITTGASPEELERCALDDGMTPLVEAALKLVREGRTTLEEVDRVVGRSVTRIRGLQLSPSKEIDEVEESARLLVVDDDEGQAATIDALLEEDGYREEPAQVVGRSVTRMIPNLPLPEKREGVEQSARLLVVDDDEGERAIVRAVLEGAGYRVFEAPSGRAGLEELGRTLDVDLVLLDLSMPGLGGRQVLDAIRTNDQTASIPVVVLTAAADPALEAELLSAGADDYMRKPLVKERFLSRIEAVLRRRHW
ncbi:MAG: ATPase, T2SS/T4P/T4SS family [Longimicrobiales bacterium]